MSGGLRQYARHREQNGLPGATLTAVQKAIKAGRIPPPRDGKLDFSACDAAWSGTPAAALKAETHQQQVKQVERCEHKPPVTEQPADENQAQRLLRVKAEREELKLAKERGELVAAADIRRQTIENERRKATALANLPKQLAPLLVMKTLDEAETILEREFEAFRQKISDEFAAGPDSNGDSSGTGE